MTGVDLFTIDVGAEIATLTRCQIQGPWQVPTELVRLAIARRARTVAVDLGRRGLRLRCDADLASGDELRDLATLFDVRAPSPSRQAAIARIEEAGLESLLWAVGLPGARLDLVCSGDGRRHATARGAGVEIAVDDAAVGAVSTELRWSCRGLGRRRALAWLETAARFAPAEVTAAGRKIVRGFPDGLYRMRIAEPLPGELAVTATGDAPALWLLEHGVLSARAVVPGYPAFAAAIEMSGVAPGAASADELRTAVTSYLPRLIDRAVQMLLLLVARLPAAGEPAASRLVSLLLSCAQRGLGRDRIMAAPIIRAREGGRRRMVTPIELASLADVRGGALAAVEPGSRDFAATGGLVVEAAPEIRAQLSSVLGCRIEPTGGVPAVGFRSRLSDLVERVRRRLGGWIGRRPLALSQMSEAERRLTSLAAGSGCPIALSAGTGGPRRRGGLIVVGRERVEIRAAVQAVAADDSWLYPALLAAAVDNDIDDGLRRRWLDSLFEF